METVLDLNEARLSPWTFGLAVFYLVVLGLVLILVPDPDLIYSLQVTITLVGILGSLWLFFLLELGLFHLANSSSDVEIRPGLWKRRLRILLFPPGHLCLRHATKPHLFWLPKWGWSRANSTLFKTLKEKLEIPMIGVALFIVPLLLIEWKAMDTLGPIFPGGRPGLHFTIKVCEALIWSAFALEFLLMVSLARDRVAYCREAWLYILIILLPLVSFLRSARVLRAARLNQLARGYRFKSVAIKVRKAVLIANAIQRLVQRDTHMRAAALLKKSRKRYQLYRQPEAQLVQLLKDVTPKERDEILAAFGCTTAPDTSEGESQP